MEPNTREQTWQQIKSKGSAEHINFEDDSVIVEKRRVDIDLPSDESQKLLPASIASNPRQTSAKSTEDVILVPGSGWIRLKDSIADRVSREGVEQQMQSDYQRIALQDRALSSQYQTLEFEGRALGSQYQTLDPAHSLHGSDYRTSDASRSSHAQYSAQPLARSDVLVSQPHGIVDGSQIKFGEPDTRDLEFYHRFYSRPTTSQLFFSAKAYMHDARFWKRLSSKRDSTNVEVLPARVPEWESGPSAAEVMIRWIDENEEVLQRAIQDLRESTALRHLEDKAVFFLQSIARGVEFASSGDYRWLCVAAFAFHTGLKTYPRPKTMAEWYRKTTSEGVTILRVMALNERSRLIDVQIADD